jgi:hypothetical protein
MNDHIQQLQKVIDQLRAQPSVRVGDIVVDPLYSQSKHQGIYEIRDRADSRTLYIGKTTVARDGVAQRIWDHAKRISGLLDTLQITPETFADYRVRSLAVPDGRLRGLAEYYGIAIFDPPGNLVG